MLVMMCGHLFLEFVPKHNDAYEWGNKLSFKIDTHDLDDLLYSLKTRTPMRKSRGAYKGLYITYQDNHLEFVAEGERRDVMFSMLPTHIVGFNVLLTKAKEVIYGW